MYVDDIVLTAFNSTTIFDFITFLSSSFSIMDLGPLHYFLGIELHRIIFGLFLSQSKYIIDLLIHTNMHASKPISTPMAISDSLNAFDGSSVDDPHYFYGIVDSLQYFFIY